MKRAESILPENKHVWMQGNKQSSSSSHKRVVSEEWNRSPEKFWRMGEEDVPKETGHHHHKMALRLPSSASRGLAMDTESRPSRKRAADVQTEDLEDNEQLDANENGASPSQAEGESSDRRMFIGNWEHVESDAHKQRL